MPEEVNIKMGQMPDVWRGGVAKSITFCVTEDCNLACKYCYMTGKNKANKMTFETAKKAVDFILSNRADFNEDSVIWDFIGGEPFLEIDLIDQISDYIKLQMYTLDHPWFGNYRFSFSTNGVLYNSPKVQEYISKNKGNISINISVDGNKLKHDLQRVKTDGSGSYDDVVKNVPLWLQQFPGVSTKATFAHDDLPYLKDSVISLWGLGINTVSANLVFEDVWCKDDDIIFENQLKELGDYVLENNLWKEHSVRFFNPEIGFPLQEEDIWRNYCGSGKMLAIDCNGNLFPCVRFYDMSLNNRKAFSIGDVNNGLNKDKIRPFLALTLKHQSTEECIKCEVASGCAWCQGCNYDLAETDTIYQRATYLCKMHKANVRATEYFWNKFEEKTGLVSPRSISRLKRFNSVKKSLQILISDESAPNCSYRNTKNTTNVMNLETFSRGIDFARDNYFEPVILGDCNIFKVDIDDEILNFIDHKTKVDNNLIKIPIFDNSSADNESMTYNCILIINKTNLNNLYEMLCNIYKTNNRVNLILEDIENWCDKDIEAYSSQLDNISEFILKSYTEQRAIELNVLTDILDQESICDCGAGVNNYTLAPNGKIYICPAFYFDNPENYIGSLESGIHIKNSRLLLHESSYICSKCDSYHCKRCIFLNKKLTGEYNTPPKIQCVISHIERNKSLELQRIIVNEKISTFKNTLGEIDYLDPLDKILNK